MFKVPVVLILLIYLVVDICAKSIHPIVFYNVENLFDTEDDPLTRDDDFTPRGKWRWGRSKYRAKISNISRVLADIAHECGEYPTIIALAEVENMSVLEDLITTPKLSSVKYQIVHYDSPDERGIDVAMLCRPDRFLIEGSCAVRSVVSSSPNYKGRDILTLWGEMEGEPMFFIAVHWASRLGGVEVTCELRNESAVQVRQIADSVIRVNPLTKVVVMGDMNDNPSENSLYEYLGAKESVAIAACGGYFNPFWAIYNEGYGTTLYGDNWHLFDNIIVSYNLVKPLPQGISLRRSEVDSRLYGNIFKRPYMLQSRGRYRGYLLRGYMGGYSDHLPVYVILE